MPRALPSHAPLLSLPAHLLALLFDVAREIERGSPLIAASDRPIRDC